MKSYSDIFNETRQRLKKSNLSVDEQGRVLNLLNILIVGIDDAAIMDDDSAAHLIEAIVGQANLLTTIERQGAELDALKRITLNLVSSLELHTVLNGVVSEAMHLVKDARDAYIYLFQDNNLIFGESLTEDGTRNIQGREPRPNGLTYTVAHQKKMVIIENTVTHPLFANAPSPWTGSIIGIPLLIGDRVVGVMNLARSRIGKFSEAELRLLTLLADQAAIAIINARLHEKVSGLARRDGLTNLPNRRALDERLDEEIARSNRLGHLFSVVMMDLDGYKIINDTYGHEVGDDVLRQIADALSQSLRTSDFIARYGGDEMTLILPNTTLPQAANVTHKLQNRLRALSIPVPDGQSITVGVTGGIALFPEHAETASGLLRAADEALYKAKKHARGTFMAARAMTGKLQVPQNSQEN